MSERVGVLLASFDAELLSLEQRIARGRRRLRDLRWRARWCAASW